MAGTPPLAPSESQDEEHRLEAGSCLSLGRETLIMGRGALELGPDRELEDKGTASTGRGHPALEGAGAGYQVGSARGLRPGWMRRA